MKKFIKNVTVVTISVIFSLLSLNTMFVHSNGYKNLLIGRELSVYEEIPEQQKIVNLGSSHGLASFAYSNYHMFQTFNYGLSGQVLTYDYEMLDHFQGYMAEDALIFLPMSYFSLYRNDLENLSFFESKNQRYYNILGIEHIIRYDAFLYWTSKYFPLWSIEVELLPTLNFKELIEDSRINYHDITEKEESEIGDIAKARYEYHNKFISDQVIDERMYEALMKIIALCEERGFTLILVTTPFYSAYNEQYSDSFYELFYSDIEEITEEYDLLYLDYSHHEDFTHDKSLFSDTDHLNIYGGEKFTDMILSEVDALIGLPNP